MIHQNAQKSSDVLTLYFIMLKNGQTYFKNLRCEHRKIFKVCLVFFQHYERKG